MTAGADLGLAPTGILRSAAWPQSSLDFLGDPDLAHLARRQGRADSGFERAYTATIERERQALWTSTITDPAFDKAIALSSRSARIRIRNAHARRYGPRNRAQRLAEFTLYRYLARAAGRATPHGLWAGVSEVRCGPQTRIETLAPACRFTPDLRPFQALLRSLAQRGEYRMRADWQINPTLQADPQGEWFFICRLADGELTRRAFQPDPESARLLTQLAPLAAAPLDRLAAEIAGRGGWPVGARRRLLHQLAGFAEVGLLVGGLDLPNRFDSVWDALAQAGESLLAGERAYWTRAVAQLNDRCGELENSVFDCSATQFVAALASAADIVRELGENLDQCGADLDEPTLRCDLRLPWRLSIDPALTARIGDALHDYRKYWLGQLSPSAAWRQAVRHRFALRLGDGLSIGDAAQVMARDLRSEPPVWPDAGTTGLASVDQRIQRWNAYLGQSGHEAVLTDTGAAHADAATSGCLFLGLGADFALSVTSVSDIPTLASSRFDGLLDNSDSNDWLRARIAAEECRSGVRLAELHAPFESRPNVLAASRLTTPCVEPWGAQAQALRLPGARIRAGGEPGQALLSIADGKGAGDYAVVSLGAADLQSGDPIAQLLLWTGGHESPGRSQPAVEVPTAAELARGRPTPRIVLPGGTVLRHPRALIAGAGLAELLSATAADRFKVWQRIAVELGLPERVQVAANAREAILIARDSPLAVEALFKGMRQDTDCIAVSHGDRNRGLQVPGHGTHASELTWVFAQV